MCSGKVHMADIWAGTVSDCDSGVGVVRPVRGLILSCVVLPCSYGRVARLVYNTLGSPRVEYFADYLR